MKMTPEQAIKIVKEKSRGRTRYEGKKPYIDEVLVAEIERLQADAARYKYLRDMGYIEIEYTDKEGEYTLKAVDRDSSLFSGEQLDNAIDDGLRRHK